MAPFTNSLDLPDAELPLKELFEIIRPENNLVLADEMMLSDASGTILWVSETYERNFGFSPHSIVGRSAFDLERFLPVLPQRSSAARKKSPPPRPSTIFIRM